MKRGLVILLTVSLVIMTLTGCASVPELSEENESMVTNYAASLLLKYDSENHTRLVDTDNFIKAYEYAKSVYEREEKEYYDAIQAEEEARREEAKAQEEMSRQYAESTSTVEIEEEKGTKGTGGATVVDARTIESFLGADGFSITYAGFDILDEYPEEGSDIYVSMPSTEGNDLLVVYFNVSNISGGASTLDILSVNPIFKLSVNGDRFTSVFMDFGLEDDMSYYVGDFASNETKRLVLITEVKEGTVVTSLDMRISLKEDSLSKNLK